MLNFHHVVSFPRSHHIYQDMTVLRLADTGVKKLFRHENNPKGYSKQCFLGQFCPYFLILTLKSLYNAFFFLIFAILSPNLAKNPCFGVTHFLTMQLEVGVRKSCSYTTSYWYFFFHLMLNQAQVFSFETIWTNLSCSYQFPKSLQAQKLHGVLQNLPFSSHFDLWMPVTWQWYTLYGWFWCQFNLNFNRNILILNLVSFLFI